MLCSKIRTSVKQALLDLLAILDMSDEPDGHGNAFSSQKAVVVAVSDGPYLSECSRLELCAAESLDGSVTGDDAELAWISTGEQSIYKRQLCLRGRE